MRAIFILRWLANRKIVKAHDDSLEIEQFLRRKKVWYDYRESLNSLFINIRFLVEKYHKGYTEPILRNSKIRKDWIKLPCCH